MKLCFACVYKCCLFQIETLLKMGSCIGKHVESEKKEDKKQEDFETKMKQYESLNRELAATRNKERVEFNQCLAELTNRNIYLIDEREKLLNLFPIIV